VIYSFVRESKCCVMVPERMQYPIFALLLFLLSASVVAPLRGQEVVYENVGQFTGVLHVSTNEYGDEIYLGGSARSLFEFAFEYRGDYATSQGDEIMRFRIYANTGPNWMGNNDYQTPAEPPLFETIVPVRKGYNTEVIQLPGLNAGDRFTWTVQFFGLTMATNDYAGLLFHGVPSVGLSYNDFWERRASGWTPLFVPNVTKNNFGAKVYAAHSVPAPRLNIALGEGTVLISWPITAGAMVLQSRMLNGASWTKVDAPPAVVDGRFEVTVPTSADDQVFRLTAQPTLTAQRLGNVTRLRWPESATGYVLQYATQLGSSWTDIPVTTTPTAGYYDVVHPQSSAAQFYRLIRR